ncbi:MAG: outer membrane protein transport protein [Acidobacteriota bacterium]
MVERSTKVRLGSLVGVFVSLAGVAHAQLGPRPQKADPSVYFGGFQFNGPGARAVGMGTAFIALADDATASEWNPAGLNVIIKPEISLQIKSTSYDTPLLVPYSNTFGTNSEDVNSFTYASYAQSFGRFAFSIYRQELTNFSARGAFQSSGQQVYGDDSLDFTSSINLDTKIVNYGASGSITFLDNKLSFGYSARYGRLSVDSTLRQDFFKAKGGASSARVNDDDTDISFNTGLLWKPNPKFSLGAVYKSGPVFEVEQVQEFGTFVKPNPPNVIRERVTIPIPDSYGIGAAFRPSDQLTFAFDAVRITYSDLNEAIRDPDKIPAFLQGDIQEAKDGNEYHAGMEYVILTKAPVSLRLGLYSEPNDRSVITEQGKSDLHYTGGVGFVFGSRFQLDAAANVSDASTEYLLSTIFRWGR